MIDAAPTSPAVVWHDLECGGYRADLALWQRLAEACATPVLDVGAGAGRVSLALARRGVQVIAVDRDAVLLDELARRAGELPVRCRLTDARTLDLPAEESTLDLCLVPMQTVQLLGGPAGRAQFLRAVHSRLGPGALLACAISEDLEAFDAADGPSPAPDHVRHGELRYLSHPTALRLGKEHAVLERRREVHRGNRLLSSELDVIELDHLGADQLAREASSAGWRPQAPVAIAPTSEHVGSTVVMLRA